MRPGPRSKGGLLKATAVLVGIALVLTVLKFQVQESGAQVRQQPTAAVDSCAAKVASQETELQLLKSLVAAQQQQKIDQQEQHLQTLQQQGQPGSEQDVQELKAKIASLEAEVKQLQATLAARRLAPAAAAASGTGSGAGLVHAGNATGAAVLSSTAVQVDLYKLLGIGSQFGGISFDPQICGRPLLSVFPGLGEAQLERIILKLTSELTLAMGKILGRPVLRTAEWHLELSPGKTGEEALEAMVHDPRTMQWREAITVILSRYMFHPNASMVLWCPDAPSSVDLEFVGKSPCPKLSTAEIVQQLGYHAVPQASIANLARDALRNGLCTKPPYMAPTYTGWLKDERMFNPAWHTFNVETPDQDAVVFLYDLLYENQGIFKKQYWMGVIAMQNPFDMLSIADIIFTTKPDLIIETGTANGGSALMWASIMHLAGIQGRVLTLDIAEPTWDPSSQHWGGIPRADATKHELWAKYVTFLKAEALLESTVERVKQEAAKAKKVMVLLDSNHGRTFVQQEMAAYCPLVSVGSYCIVEDTKMSRWSSDGPLEAVKMWVEKSGGAWVSDRERELLYSHHAMGYLLRKK